MANVRRACLWVVFCLTAVPWLAVAQESPTSEPTSGPPPAHIAYIEGRAFIDREGRSEDALVNMPLVDGDRLRVEDGRVEIILPDGSLLHLDQQTTADALAPDLWRLLRGRLILTVRGVRDPSRAVRSQIDASAASVRNDGPGEFRVWASETDRGRDVELAVSRGRATLANEFGAQQVQAGERSYAREGFAPSTPQYFNSARWDAFDRWSATRRDTSVAVASARYLPDELDVYASAFDRYGTWRVDPTYGNVWYPTVAANWRPYSVGYWQTYPSWGSFWIGSDPWGWPTHHYGRWGFHFNAGWYWMPMSSWAPAWVYWGMSSNYVSWCALGYNNYPVFGHWGVYGAYDARSYDPWRGWTVMPRHHFRAGMPVHGYAVDGRVFDAATRGAFVAQRRAPGGIAVPRSYAGGATAVPRGSAGPTAQLPGAVPRSGADRLGPTRGTTTGRVFSTDAPRAGTPRTEAPSNTPDTTAFSSRRSAVPRYSNAPGVPAGEPAESRYRARGLPDSMRSIFPSNGSTPPATPQPAAAEPRRGASPRSDPTPFPNRRSNQPAESPRYAPNYDAPPRYEAAPRTQPTPRSEAPPAYQPTQRNEGSRREQPSRQERSAPRSEPSYRQPSSSGGSPGSAAPRYNPGSSAGSPRSGSSSPPSRRRGGAPDQ